MCKFSNCFGEEIIYRTSFINLNYRFWQLADDRIIQTKICSRSSHIKDHKNELGIANKTES